ncbi:hypothetical protein [Streptomyces sp. NBC_00005]|uniref:hypothetical protein n=1 Tax=Streptomyces sp. NBC_00005 TaxID=2903609 RepID=UPI00324572A5
MVHADHVLLDDRALVEVGGVTFTTGDILHADEDGVVLLPGTAWTRGKEPSGPGRTASLFFDEVG